jgi:hypothetical protein
MKKLILLLALFVGFSSYGFAQQDLWMDGKSFVIGPSGTTTDTVIDLGYVDMMLSPRGDAGGLQFPDSLHVIIETGDSLRGTLFAVPNYASTIATETIADSVAAIYPSLGLQTFQATTKDVIPFYWFKIKAAIGDNAYSSSLRLYLRVFQVGSEVRSSNKYFRVIAKRLY